MDWSNEDYVKVYTRETDDDLMLSWQALALWRAMLLKFDRSGMLETRRGVRGLAALVRIPADVVEAALPELLEDGRLESVPAGYFAPNFLAAQEASKSDRQRQKESRERRAASARRGDPPGRQGFIYACVAGSGEVKIGFASNVEERVQSLRTARPDGLTIIGSWPGSTIEEAEIFERFSHLKIAGEWFKDDPAIRLLVSQRTTASQVVTAGHDSSQPVTLTSADPLLPDPEDLSLPRAIPQAVLEQQTPSRGAGAAAPSVPAVSQSEPTHEDIAETRSIAGDQFEASKSTASSQVPRPYGDQQQPVGSRDPKPSSAIPPGESAWQRKKRWWDAMLAADARIRTAGIEPNAPSLPKNFAGENERNMAACERQLVDSGFTPDEVDAKMLHIVAVAEAEALRSDNRSRKWFKPAVIWDPERANRQFDTSLDEAAQPRAGPGATRTQKQPPGIVNPMRPL